MIIKEYVLTAKIYFLSGLIADMMFSYVVQRYIGK